MLRSGKKRHSTQNVCGKANRFIGPVDGYIKCTIHLKSYIPQIRTCLYELGKRAGLVSELISLVHLCGEINARLPRERLATCQKLTSTHCLNKRCMSSKDIFVSVVEMKYSYGRIFIPLPEISPVVNEISLTGCLTTPYKRNPISDSLRQLDLAYRDSPLKEPARLQALKADEN